MTCKCNKNSTVGIEECSCSNLDHHNKECECKKCKPNGHYDCECGCEDCEKERWMKAIMKLLEVYRNMSSQPQRDNGHCCSCKKS